MLSKEAQIITFPNVPNYDRERTVLLFPTDDALATADIPDNINKLVVVDSQWHKTHQMLRHPNLKGLLCVKISSYKTAFWRYQLKGDDFLSTIEGLFSFFSF